MESESLQKKVKWKRTKGDIFFCTASDYREVGEEGGGRRRNRSGRGKYMGDCTWEARKQRERI
jgi:hypothetical protein